MLAVIYHLDFLHEKEVVKYLLNYKCHSLYLSLFEKLLQSSTKKSKSYNPQRPA